MAGFSLGDLFGALKLDDTQFTEALVKAGGATRLFRVDLSAIGDEVKKLEAQLVAAGYSGKEFQTWIASLRAQGLSGAEATEVLSKSISDLKDKLRDVYYAELEATAAADPYYQATRAAAKAANEAAEAERERVLAIIKKSQASAAATEKELTEYRSLIEAERIRDESLKAQYATQQEMAALTARFRAQELQQIVTNNVATNEGFRQEAAYRAARDAERLASETEYARLRQYFRGLEVESEEATQALRVEAEAAADARRLAIFTETQKVQEAEFIASVRRQVVEQKEANAAMAAMRAQAGQIGSVVGYATGTGGFAGRAAASALFSGPVLAAGAIALSTYELSKWTTESASAERSTANFADKLNITWKEARQLEEEAKLAGISITALDQASSRIASSMDPLAVGSKHVADALKSIGVESGTSGDRLMAMLEALSHIDDDSVRLDKLRQIVGRGSVELEVLVGNYGHLREAIASLGDPQTHTGLQRTAESISQLSISWDRFKASLADGLVGTIFRDFIDAVRVIITPNENSSLLKLPVSPAALATTLAERNAQKQGFYTPGGKFLDNKTEKTFGPNIQEVDDARAWRDVQVQTLEGMKQQIALDIQEIAANEKLLGLQGDLAVKSDERKRLEAENVRLTAEQLTLAAKVSDITKKQETPEQARSRVFGTLGIQDYKTTIAQAQSALDEGISKGFFTPEQIADARGAIQKMQDAFTDAESSITKSIDRIQTRFGSTNVEIQYTRDLLKQIKDMQVKEMEGTIGNRTGKLDGIGLLAPVPQTGAELREIKEENSQIVAGTEKWDMLVAHIADNLDKIHKAGVKEGLVGPGGPNSEILRIEQFAKDHGVKIISQTDLDTSAAYAKQVLNDLYTYQRNGGYAAAQTVASAQIAFIEATSRAQHVSADEFARTIGLNYQALRKQIEDTVKAGNANLRNLVQGIGRDIQGIFRSFSSNLIDLVLPKFGTQGADPLQPLVEQFRAAYDKLAAYADPKGALNALVNSIRDAGTASEANAIAVKYFGETAGPQLAKEIRQGTYSAGQIQDAINKASQSTVDYANQTNNATNAVSKMWAQLAHDIVAAITKQIIQAGIKVLLDWMSGLKTHTQSIGDDIIAIWHRIKDAITGTSKAAQDAASGVGSAGNLGSGGGGGIPDVSGGGNDGSGGGGGGGGEGGGAGGLLGGSALGWAQLGVSVLSGIVQGIQGAHMNNLLGEIEISTRSSLAEALNLRRDQWDQYNHMYDRIGEFMDMVKEASGNSFTRLGEILTSLRGGTPSISPIVQSAAQTVVADGGVYISLGELNVSESMTVGDLVSTLKRRRIARGTT